MYADKLSAKKLYYYPEPNFIGALWEKHLYNLFEVTIRLYTVDVHLCPTWLLGQADLSYQDA